jgi:hypothetical protein
MASSRICLATTLETINVRKGCLYQRLLKAIRVMLEARQRSKPRQRIPWLKSSAAER